MQEDQNRWYYAASAVTGLLALGADRHSNGHIIGFTTKKHAMEAILAIARIFPSAELIVVVSDHCMWSDTHVFDLRHDAVKVDA